MTDKKITVRECERKTVEVKKGGSVTVQPSKGASAANKQEEKTDAEKA